MYTRERERDRQTERETERERESVCEEKATLYTFFFIIVINQEKFHSKNKVIPSSIRDKVIICSVWNCTYKQF